MNDKVNNKNIKGIKVYYKFEKNVKMWQILKKLFSIF